MTSGPASAAPLREETVGVVELPRTGVRLRPGPFADRLDRAVEVYAGLGVDRPLKGFRRKAGLPCPGEDLEGWARHTSEATFGQWVSGLARLSAVLDDADLRDQVVGLVDGWAETLPADGNPRMATYGWEKAACGLVDAAVYAGHEPALDVLTATAAWARTGWDLSRSPATRDDRDGRRPHGTLEWYTLAENLYRGYERRRDPVLADCARLWHYDSYWRHFATAPDRGRAWDVPVWLHAYSHVNTFASAAAAARVTGSDQLLQVARNGDAWARCTQTYATGAFGPGEWTVPQDGTLGRSLEWRPDTAEVPCEAWAVIKLAGYLLSATGAAVHLDWAENLIMNGIGAALPIRPDGQSFYYADYRLGAISTKLWHWDAWPCCSGTYLQALAGLHELIFAVDRDQVGRSRAVTGVRIGLFLPAEITLDTTVGTVKVVQEVDDLGTTSRITVRSREPVDLALRVRVPPWSRGLTVRTRVRGSAAQTRRSGADQDSAGWLKVEGRWADGDGLEIDLGAGLRAIPVDPQHPRRVAFGYGAQVLAQDAVFSAPVEKLGALEPTALDRAFGLDADHEGGPAFVPTDRGSAEQPIGALRPFAAFGYRTPYRLYHDPDRPRFL